MMESSHLMLFLHSFCPPLFPLNLIPPSSFSFCLSLDIGQSTPPVPPTPSSPFFSFPCYTQTQHLFLIDAPCWIKVNPPTPQPFYVPLSVLASCSLFSSPFLPFHLSLLGARSSPRAFNHRNITPPFSLSHALIRPSHLGCIHSFRN